MLGRQVTNHVSERPASKQLICSGWALLSMAHIVILQTEASASHKTPGRRGHVGKAQREVSKM